MFNSILCVCHMYILLVKNKTVGNAQMFFSPNELIMLVSICSKLRLLVFRVKCMNGHYTCSRVLVWPLYFDKCRSWPVAKMASHAIFQYIVLAIDDTHNTWTNMIVKMIILRLLGSSDDKEKIGKVRPEGSPLRGFRSSVGSTGRTDA